MHKTKGSAFFQEESDVVLCAISNSSHIEQQVHIDFSGYDRHGSFASSHMLTIPANKNRILTRSDLGKEYRGVAVSLTTLWAIQPNSGEVLILDTTGNARGMHYTISVNGIEKSLQHTEAPSVKVL